MATASGLRLAGIGPQHDHVPDDLLVPEVLGRRARPSAISASTPIAVAGRPEPIGRPRRPAA